MRKIRILLVAVLAASACLVAAPTQGNAAPPNLTITCTQAPAQCTAFGQIGPLYGVTQVTATHGATALICLDATCQSGALLVIRPTLLQAFAEINNVVQLQLYLSGLSASVVAFTNSILLSLGGSNGVIGVLLLTQGHTLCLALDHLKLSTTAC